MQPQWSKYGQVAVHIDPNGSIDALAYKGSDLLSALVTTIAPLGLTKQFWQVITDVMDSITLIPRNNQKHRIEVGDKLFERLFGAYQVHFGLDNPTRLTDYWYQINRFVITWEKNHVKIHKGTLYYWLGYANLRSGNVTAAYISFHNAIEEDKHSYRFLNKPYANSPASLTMSLIDIPNNALHRAVVIPIRTELSSLLTNYCVHTSSSLAMSDIDNKFLKESRHEHIKIVFTEAFHSLYNIRELIRSGLIENDYSRLRLGNLLFHLCLVVDQLLHYRYLRHTRVRERDRNMGKAVYRLCLNSKLTTKKKCPEGDFFKRFNPPVSSKKLGKALTTLLDNKGEFDGKVLPYSIASVMVAYRLRNFVAHHIQGESIFVKRYPDLYARVMDSFFVAVEKL